MKKAQIAGQVFIFILAAVVAALILAYGYGAIKKMIARTDEIAMVSFKTDLQSSVRTIASDYGTVRRLDLRMPGESQTICFIDINYPSRYMEDSCLCKICTPTHTKDFSPEICDAWTTPNNKENAFLIPINPIRLTAIELEDPGYLCIFPKRNKLSLKLEGLGNRTKISEWPLS